MAWSDEQEKIYQTLAQEYNQTGGKGWGKVESTRLAALAKRRAEERGADLNRGAAPTVPVADSSAPAPAPVNVAGVSGGGMGQAIAQAVGLAPDRSRLGSDGKKLVPTPDPAAVAAPSSDPVFADLQAGAAAPVAPTPSLTPQQATTLVPVSATSSGGKRVQYGKPIDRQLIASTELLNEKYNKLAVDEGKIQQEAERQRAENAIANADAIAESAHREFVEQQKIAKRLDEQEKLVNKSIDELDRTVVDPSRYMSSRNAWQRFSTMMGAVLGGALEGWTGGAIRDNTFQILQQRIDADIEAQKVNLANKSNVVAQKKSVLGFLRQRLGDPALAENVLRQQINKRTALMAEAIGANSNSEKVKINVEKYKLDREKELIELKAKQTEMAQNKVEQHSNYSQQKEMLGTVLPKINKEMTSLPPAPEKLKTKVGAGQSAREMLVQAAEMYRDIVGPSARLGGKALWGGDIGKFWNVLSTTDKGIRFLNHLERTSRELGHFGEVGALQAGEVEPYKNSLLIRSPSMLKDRLALLPQALADADQWIRTKTSADLNVNTDTNVSQLIAKEATSRARADRAIQSALDTAPKR